MPTSQAGIFAGEVRYHYFLEYTVPLADDPQAVAGAIRAARAALEPAAAARLVMGFGGDLWGSLAPDQVPGPLRPFRTIAGHNGKAVPGTQNDLWLWLSGDGTDGLFHAALRMNRALNPVAALRLEQPGFHYLDGRDMTGFIDGTANPTGEEAREAALIPASQPGAGGSYLIAMRWVHDLAAFHALPVTEQERAIGRRKADSEELSDDEKPETAHIARVEVEQDGEELAIFRRSVPYGTLSEHGLYFLAFSREPTRFDLMLRRMYGLTGDGIEDRLTDFSRPVTAAYYYAPPQEALEQALKG
jgi:putative iron-dependent peroxidase